jgi:hypothetical protein
MLTEPTPTQEACLDDLFGDVELSLYSAVNACLQPRQSGMCDELIYPVEH